MNGETSETWFCFLINRIKKKKMIKKELLVYFIYVVYLNVLFYLILVLFKLTNQKK